MIGSVGTGTCHQHCWPEFNSQDLHVGRKGQTPKSGTAIFTHVWLTRGFPGWQMGLATHSCVHHKHVLGTKVSPSSCGLFRPAWILKQLGLSHPTLLLFVRFINKLQPGSVKKVNESTQNWHQVSPDTRYQLVSYFSNEA